MKRITFIFLICAFIITSCAQDKDYLVTIKTSYGDMTAILYDETPKHKENFVKLAREHFFDSTLFHRVIEGFMIQGGDPDSKKAQPGQPLGRGGPGYTVEAEFNKKFFHERGALSAARLGDQQNPKKASSGSQFYIVQGTVIDKEELTIDGAKFNQAFGTFFGNPANQSALDSLKIFQENADEKGYKAYLLSLKPRVEKQTGVSVEKFVAPEKLKAYTTLGGSPMLDDQYTVFGKVIKGLDIIDKIAAQPTDRERPLEDIRMTVTVEEISKKKIEKLYGYQYP